MNVEIREMTPEDFQRMREEHTRDKLDHALTEEDLEPLKRYVEERIETGGFLRAVLSNDLMEACGRADLYNRRRLFEYVEYLYNECPKPCWGSKEAVKKWLANEEEA